VSAGRKGQERRGEARGGEEMDVSRRARAKESSDSGFLDKWLPRTAAILLCVVAVVQGLLRYEDMRTLLNESLRLEGEPLARAIAGLDRPAYPWLDSMVASSDAKAVETDETGESGKPTGNAGKTGEAARGVIYLRLLSKPKGEVWALVNGRAVKLITEDDGVLACKDGDLIEILCEKGEANVLVTYVSDNLAQPAQGVWVKGSGILFLSRVTAK